MFGPMNRTRILSEDEFWLSRMMVTITQRGMEHLRQHRRQQQQHGGRRRHQQQQRRTFHQHCRTCVDVSLSRLIVQPI